MGKCKHQGKRFLRRWIPVTPGLLPKAITTETDICADCGEWFGLGPSNDTPREVQIEIRAAAIERNYAESPKSKLGQFARNLDGAEYAGWIEHQFDSAKVPEQDGEWSGWLARAVASHPEEQS